MPVKVTLHRFRQYGCYILSVRDIKPPHLSFLFSNTGGWTQGLHTELYLQPFFLKFFFWDWALLSHCSGWVCTHDPSASASGSWDYKAVPSGLALTVFIYQRITQKEKNFVFTEIPSKLHLQQGCSLLPSLPLVLRNATWQSSVLFFNS